MWKYINNILIRNQQVGGSTPPVGSITFKGITVTYSAIPFSIVNHKTRQIKAKYGSSATLFVPLFLIIFIGGTFSGCASINIKPDPWTKDQILLQGVATTLNVIDWGQTLDIAEKPDEYSEMNPVLGDHPSRAEVNRYMAYTMTLRLLIAHILPSKYRNAWLGASILVSGYFVEHNYHIGLRTNF